MVSDIIRKYRRSCIFHFTDSRNIDSIKTLGGLFSYMAMKEIGVAFFPGGNQWSHDADSRFGLEDYIHCSFVDSHPMCYRAVEEGRIDPVWLAVDLSVLESPTVKYAMDAANKAGTMLIDEKTASLDMDFEAVFSYLSYSNPKNKERKLNAYRYEVLIPRFIPWSKLRVHKHG